MITFYPTHTVQPDIQRTLRELGLGRDGWKTTRLSCAWCREPDIIITAQTTDEEVKAWHIAHILCQQTTAPSGWR